MKMLKSCGTALYLISVSLLGAGTLSAADGEKSVKLGDLPAAVQKTVREQSKGGKVAGLAIEVENGKTSYEAELKIKGQGKDIVIDENGVVREVEERTELSALPAAAVMQLKKSAGKGKIVRVEAISKDGAPAVYEALVKTGGVKSEITVAADGKLISDITLKGEAEKTRKGEAAARKAAERK